VYFVRIDISIFGWGFYGCENWFIKFRGKNRPRVFRNKMLRRIFRPKWDGVTVEWKRLHNEEL
jgi:hypothetical protein